MRTGNLRFILPAAFLLTACGPYGSGATGPADDPATAGMTITIAGPRQRALGSGDSLVLRAELHRQKCNAEGQECTWVPASGEVTWWTSDEATLELAGASGSEVTVWGRARGTATIEARHSRLRAQVRIEVGS